MNAVKIQKTILLSLVILMLALSGCANASPSQPAANASNDLLGKILNRGTIIVATDADYPPQSKLIENATRPADTKCRANEYTSSQMEGFDIEVAVELAKRMGVEACFVTPAWSSIISGNWGGRWDIHIGSMGITPERLQVLYFTQPYSAGYSVVFVQEDSKYKTPANLSGKRVGVCSGCTSEEYLKGTLVTPGSDIKFDIKDAEIVSYDVDTAALEDLANGLIDGVVTDQFNGAEAMARGLAIKKIGEPVYFAFGAMATDKNEKSDSRSLAIKASEIIKQMHADGFLPKLNTQYFGEDFISSINQFDLDSLEQFK